MFAAVLLGPLSTQRCLSGSPWAVKVLLAGVLEQVWADSGAFGLRENLRCCGPAPRPWLWPSALACPCPQLPRRDLGSAPGILPATTAHCHEGTATVWGIPLPRGGERGLCVPQSGGVTGSPPPQAHLHAVRLGQATAAPESGEEPVLQVDDGLPDLLILGQEVVVVECDLQVFLHGQAAGQLKHPAEGWERLAGPIC